MIVRFFTPLAALTLSLGLALPKAWSAPACADLFKRTGWETAYLSLPERWQSIFEADPEAKRALEDRLRKSTDVYATEGLMNPGASRDAVTLATSRKIAAFVLLTKTDFISSRWTTEKIAEKLALWVKSPEDANFVYQNLEAFGPSADRVFDSLLAHSPWFANALPIRGVPRSLQTFSFEKETPSSGNVVGMLWRPKEISEAEWLKLSDGERRARLAEPKGTVPTSLGDARYGKLTNEAGGSVKEFRHPSYEFDFARVRSLVGKVSTDFSETHSFHVHHSFDVLASGPSVPKFKMWYKIRGDHLHLKALESGLHSTFYSTVGNMPNAGERIVDDKFHTLGLRTGMYGHSKSPKHIRVGLEARDANRNLGELLDDVAANAAEVRNQVWLSKRSPRPEAIEGQDYMAIRKSLEDPVTDLPTLDPRDHAMLARAGISPEFIQLMSRLYADLPIPLQDFESKVYFNYRLGQPYRPTPEQRARIVSAREHFLSEIKKLEQELEERKRAGHRDETEEIEIAL